MNSKRSTNESDHDALETGSPRFSAASYGYDAAICDIADYPTCFAPLDILFRVRATWIERPRMTLLLRLGDSFKWPVRRIVVPS